MKPTTMDHEAQLEREADLARKRLLDTVDELDARKHVVESRVQSVSLLPVAAAAIGGFVLLTAAYDAISSFSRRRRRRRALRRFARRLHLR